MPDTTFAELSSARLVLRRLRPDDVAAICAYRALPEVARYQSWDTYTPHDAEQLVAKMHALDPDTPGTWFQLGITLGDELIGDCGLHFLDAEQVELGITLSPAHQGRGYAAESVARVLKYLFADRGKHRVTATTDAANAAAASLFARLGFRKEAHFVQNVWFKGAWGDEFAFALLRDKWAD